MNPQADLLEYLINEDFGYTSKETSRWGKGEKHDSLVLDKDRGIFFWNSQGVVGNALTYLMRVRGMEISKAKELLRDLSRNTLISVVKNHKNQNVIVQPKLVEVFFENGMRDRDYFYKRGLTDSIINRFQLGKFNGYSTVPFFDDGQFKNFQMRKEEPKVIKGYYSNVGPLLFNSDILKIVDKVYYAEGPVDAMALIQNGLPCVSSNCAGGYLNKWYGRFSRIKEIIILFDNDSAGNTESKRLAKFLGENRCKIYNFWDFEMEGYDPVDYFRDKNSKEELMKLINEKGKYGFELWTK